MDPPKLNKDQLTRLPDSRKHSLVFDWLTKVTDFLRESNNTQIRAAQVEIFVIDYCSVTVVLRMD